MSQEMDTTQIPNPEMFTSVSRNLVKRTQNFSKTCAELCSANFSSATQQEPKVVDFRSDTFSLPTEEMKAAMFNAKVGNAGYHEDPSKIALEKKFANLFEKEDAVFVTSGTMANLVSVLVHCRQRPSEIILGHMSHMCRFEQMVGAQFGGVNLREIKNNPDGTFNIGDLKNLIRTNELYEPKTNLICVENTHNLYGGKILPLEWLNEVAEVAKSRNIPLHMDGSRIFNASVKSGVPVSKIAKEFDTVNVCLSKGLGCPYGSVLIGSKKFISQATNTIKALGGGVRQIGYMAAAGIYALDNMVDRLQDDHEHVQMIANAVREMNHPYVKVSPAEEIHTNILNIYLDTSRISTDDFVLRLRTVSKDGPFVAVKALSFMDSAVRFVACCNVSKSDMPDVVEKIKSVIRELK